MIIILPPYPSVPWSLTFCSCSQIIANLQTVSTARGGPQYPEIFRKVVAAIEGVTVDIIEIIHLDCHVDGHSYVTKLYAATLFFLGATGLTLALEGGRVAIWGGHLVRGSVFKWLVILLYFSLPVTSSIICEAFDCTEFDTGLDASPDRYMYVCFDPRHRMLSHRDQQRGVAHSSRCGPPLGRRT